jgi:membrane-bound serine protease (ClpP class)
MYNHEMGRQRLDRKIIFILCCMLLAPFYSWADVVVVDIDGVVNPVMAEFLSRSIDEASAENQDLIVIRLDTPGGLDTSMRDIVKKIISSKVPVVVFVAPSGARAASAGVFITLSAHIAAMAPGTNIGAAHPVGVGGKMDKEMTEKVVNDAAAYLKSLAEKRGRNAEWAVKAVRESVSITETEALKMKVVDIVATDIKALLDEIDGKIIDTSEGRITLHTKGLAVVYREMGLRHRVLDIISNPNVAYLLMLLGFYGIFFELTNPGAVFPGVLGVLSLILAMYSFQTLPVNYAGLLLILLALVLFILELKITSFGMLTVGGIISMTIGSIMLFDSPFPFLRVSLAVIIPSVAVTVIVFLLVIGLVLRAHRRKPATGSEELIGMEGTARSDILKDGSVFVHGEIWSAFSDVPVSKGEKVVIEKVEGLRLKIRPLE